MSREIFRSKWLQNKVREGLDETADQDLQDMAEDDEQENHGDFHDACKELSLGEGL